jgi:hypothetical protein
VVMILAKDVKRKQNVPNKTELESTVPVKPNFRSFVQFAVAAQPKFYVSFPGLRGSKILINLI